ncbi:hypothetical protein AYO21_10302 [Fonsecaea monophora]|uniref:Uncharacterized protein n=1 Tax=Fonsecaea monophora TaxID=254056 RepID=A0A177ETZ8_9EURO|nr:hypothetical protein AYO21_10302 [Fonsecaea monophora]KAH0835138.1 hypothetical protein FOPE_03841 [Fonsecaea pedrosoi]OAG35494.1 hypothetical protein AYO21_10302 [Fonsecaea monophora]
MAPRAKPTTTPTRRMTRPSAMRRTPAVPSTPAASASAATTQGATGNARNPRTARRNNTTAPPNVATSSTQVGSTPAKAASAKIKPKATPAKKTPATIKHTKEPPNADKKDGKGTGGAVSQGTPNNTETSTNPEDGETSKSPRGQIGSLVSSPPPAIVMTTRKHDKTKAGKRKLKPLDEQAYVEEDDSEDELSAVSAEKIAPTSTVAVEDESSSEEEEINVAQVRKSRARKRKTRPFDDQAYKSDGDSEDDDDEDLDDDVPGDLPPNPLQRIHLKVNRDNHERHMRERAARRTQRSSPTSSSSSSSGPSEPPRTPRPAQHSPSLVSQRSTGPRPKRQRTAPPTVVSPSTPRSRTSQPGAVDPNDPVVLAEQLFADVQKVPRSLDLDEIGALFMVLQERISRFCGDHFAFGLTSEQEKAWPMHLLATKYLSLMLMTQRIADGCEYGWRNFFTKREHRRHLVHGVIGEWFQQRIFKHTAFSIPDDKVRALEDIDRRYLHYDAFVRNKKKAECLEELKIGETYFPSAEFPNNYEHIDNLEIAARKMATNLLLVLEPLLPPPFFDPLVPKWRQSSRVRDEGAEMRFGIWLELVELIKMAGSLHLCIRFAGVNGVVVRIAPHVPKGTRLNREDVDRNICVNAYRLNAQKAQSLPTSDQLKIKMTCFGRVEAVVPHGLDVLELEQAQEAARAAGQELTREEAEQRLFNLYPYDLQETDAARDAVADLASIPGTEWSTMVLKTKIREIREKRYGRRPQEDERAERADPKSGAFVTVYSRVAPSNIYCEWMAAQEASLFPYPEAQPPAQTLAEAVAEARREKYISCSLEDAALAVWSTVTQREFLEWLLFSGSIAGISALAAPWIRSTIESLHLGDRSRDLGTGIQLRATRALSAAANWRSALRDASAYVSQLVVPSASTVTVTSVVTDWATTTTTQPTNAGDPPLKGVSFTSVTPSESFVEDLPEALRGVTDTTRIPIPPDHPDFAMVASLFSEQMGFARAETLSTPQSERTPSSRISRSKVL